MNTSLASNGFGLHSQRNRHHKVVETNPESPLRGGPIMPPVDIVWEPSYDF